MRKFLLLSASALAVTLSLSACTGGGGTPDYGTPDYGTGPSATPGSSRATEPTPLPAPPSRTTQPALDAVVRTSLANAKVAVTAYSTAHNGQLPKQLSSATLGKYGFTAPRGVKYTGYQTDAKQTPAVFCITGSSAGGKLYIITSGTAAAEGAICPADHSKW